VRTQQIDLGQKCLEKSKKKNKSFGRERTQQYLCSVKRQKDSLRELHFIEEALQW
jgi:hypothetical protein